MEKRCSTCKAEKDVREFSKSSANKDGLFYWCKVCVKKYSAARYKENRNKLLRQHKNWTQKNRKHLNDYRKKWNKKKWDNDINHRLGKSVSTRMRFSLKGQKRGMHWESLVAYNVNDLKKHLKKTMPKGYTWQDFLDGKLHIDHKIPMSVFNFSEPRHIDFKKCFALNNLQLLVAFDNLSKKDKRDGHFQPSLRIDL